MICMGYTLGGRDTHARQTVEDESASGEKAKTRYGGMDEMMQDREARGRVWCGVLNLVELVIVVLGGSKAVLEAI